MSVTAYDFQEFALSLCNSDKEIDQRNAIGRSYYSAFHIACELAETLPMVEYRGDPRSHEKILQILAKQLNTFPNAKKLRSLSARLGKMRGNRFEADYDLHLDIGKTELETQLADYEGFIRKLQEMK